MARVARLVSALIFATPLHSLSLEANEDVILPPVYDGKDLPERLLIFIPGALVPTVNYKATAQAIQDAATELRLTVVIPATFQKKCILQCPSSGACFLLKQAVDAAVAKANFTGGNPKEDTFVAGHSMGSICANSLVTGYSYQYAGLMEFGGYVDKEGASSVANYPIPLLHLSGELDGGGARPGKLSLFYKQFRTFADQQGIDEALVRKPVLVLRGVNHLGFAPGFNGTIPSGDIPAEVSEEESVQSIAVAVAAFMHLNSPSSQSAKDVAMATVKDLLKFSLVMFDPYLKAFEFENSGSLCEEAQRTVAGLSAADADRLKVDVGAVPFSVFEHGRTNYTVDSGNLQVHVVGSFEEPGGFGPLDIHGAAKSIDCKMLDATRIAEQLGVTTRSGIPCGELTERAVALAMDWLPPTSIERYLARNRGICSAEDITVFGNIGPLFVKKGSIETTETAECLKVSALALVNDITVSFPGFPGVHYCKLMSPALALEWMMTDGVKPFKSKFTGSIEDFIV